MYNQYSPTPEQNFWLQRQAEADELNKGIDTRSGMHYLGNDGEIRYKKYSTREKRKLDVFQERIFNPTPPSQTKGNRYKNAQQEALIQAARITAMRQHQDFMNRPANPDNLTPYGRQMYDRIYDQ